MCNSPFRSQEMVTMPKSPVGFGYTNSYQPNNSKKTQEDRPISEDDTPDSSKKPNDCNPQSISQS